MTDVIGRLVSYADGIAVIEKRDGALVRVAADDVVTAKPVPDGTRRRRTRPAQDFTAEEVMAIATRGWPPVESAPLGAWLLRAAAGFTGRANSVAVHGDPGVAGDVALDRVTAFYEARGLPTRAQVVVGSAWEELFTGWQPSTADPYGGAVVQVADLAGALAAVGSPDARIEVGERADDAWLALYHRAQEHPTGRVRAVLEGPPRVGFVRIGHPPVAIARVAVTGEWAGLSCVEVAGGHRGEGLARSVVEACLRWAVEYGADKAYLQVGQLPGGEQDPAAAALYGRYGFGDHHAYRYLYPRR